MEEMGRTDSTIQFVQPSEQSRSRWIGELCKAVAFMKKDMNIALSYKLQFIFQFLQIFFNVAVIYFIGKMLGEAGRTAILKEYGSDYFSFALVGLAINSYHKAGLVTVTNNIRQTMTQGTLEAICASPINYAWLLLCSSLWQFIFQSIRVGCYFATAIVVFGMRLPEANWLGGVVSLFLTAGVFLTLGIMSSSILILVKRGDPISWVLSGLGALLAGTMFPVKVLPWWLQVAGSYLPLTHSLEAMRQCLLTGAGLREVAINILALLGFIAFLVPVTIYVNTLCMRSAKKRGAFLTH